MTTAHEDQFTPAPVEVTQADRLRAADLLGGATPDGLLQGRKDDLSLIQALARHRIAHTAPAGEVEPVAWRYEREGYAPVVFTDPAPYHVKAGYIEIKAYAHPPASLNDELVEAGKEALRQIEKYAEFFCDEDFDPTVDRLRAAIAKHGGA